VTWAANQQSDRFQATNASWVHPRPRLLAKTWRWTHSIRQNYSKLPKFSQTNFWKRQAV